MSFSGDVKEELARDIDSARHCMIAEMSAIIGMCGRVSFDEEDHVSICIQTENVTAAKKYFTLLKKTFNIEIGVIVGRNRSLSRNRMYQLSVSEDADARKILKTCRLMRSDHEIAEDFSLEDGSLLQRECCKRAFIRGAFLAAGSLSDPVKAYHFEIVCATEAKALFIQSVLSALKVYSGVVARKKSYVVYVKDSSQVVELLGLMGAHLSLMDMENVRIMKEMRNEVNRKVNCETANIQKTVTAAMKQLDDIALIKEADIFDQMPEPLREIALLREKYPEASLIELGKMLDAPVGKSGVNHRLKKIHEIALGICENQEGS